MGLSEAMAGGDRVLSHNAERHDEYQKTFNPVSTTSTNPDYGKGRKGSQVQGLSGHPYAPGHLALFSSTFHGAKRTSIADFHYQNEEILSGRYKGSEIPSILGRKDELLRMQMR